MLLIYCVFVFFLPEGMSKCATCEFVMDFVQSILADQPMVQFFQDELAKLCLVLPVNYRIECRAIAASFEPELYGEFVQKYLDPINFCTGVRVCPEMSV